MSFAYNNRSMEMLITASLRERLQDYEFMNTSLPNTYLYDKNGYCSVDFAVVKNNLVQFYLEVRCRKNIEHYTSLFVNKVKLIQMQERYTNSIIVWYDACNYDNLYFCYYHDELLQCDGYGNAVKVPKRMLSKGIDELEDYIRENYRNELGNDLKT